MLLQMRGSKACANREFFDIFRGNRYYICLASLATSTSTFLALEEWKERPWQLASVSKNTGDTLLDLLMDLPALIERQHHQKCVSTITGEALEVLGKLQHWWDDWKSLPSSRMYDVEVQNDPEGRKTWSTEIDCVSLCCEQLRNLQCNSDTCHRYCSPVSRTERPGTWERSCEPAAHQNPIRGN